MQSQTGEHYVQLVRDARAGSRSALSRLVELHYNALSNYVRSMVNDRHEAEDITQDTLKRACENIELMVHDGFKPWLLRIARNLVYNENRRRTKLRMLSFDVMIDKIGDHLPKAFQSPDPNRTIPERVVVQQVLDEMPPIHREILLFSREWGLSSKEIARLLDTSSGAARQRLYRAERDFRARYAALFALEAADADWEDARL